MSHVSRSSLHGHQSVTDSDESERKEDIARHLAYEDAKVVRLIVSLKEKAGISQAGCRIKQNCKEGSRPDFEPETQHHPSREGREVITFNRNISLEDAQRCQEIIFSQSHYLSQLDLYEMLRYTLHCPVSQVQLTVSADELIVQLFGRCPHSNWHSKWMA